MRDDQKKGVEKNHRFEFPHSIKNGHDNLRKPFVVVPMDCGREIRKRVGADKFVGLKHQLSGADVNPRISVFQKRPLEEHHDKQESAEEPNSRNRLAETSRE